MPKTHPPMYLIHKYWGRKPYNVVSDYISSYTNENDLILDPFCGSGVSVAEALLLKRRAMGIDLNPFSIFLSRNTLLPVSIDKLRSLGEKIIHKLYPLEKELYGISCPECGGEDAKITHVIYKNLNNFNAKNGSKKRNIQYPLGKILQKSSNFKELSNSDFLNTDNIEEIRFSCKKCKISNRVLDPLKYNELIQFENQRIKKINTDYIKLLEKYEIVIPNLLFKYNSEEKFRQLRHSLIKNPSMEELFTKRNLIMLGAIKKEILKLKEAEELNLHGKNLLNLSDNEQNTLVQSLFICFSSSIGQSSKMVWVISNRNKKKLSKSQVGSWTHHFFWDPNQYFEINPIISFETRLKKIISAKRNLMERIVNSEQKIEDFVSKIRVSSKQHNRHNYFVEQGRVTEILKKFLTQEHNDRQCNNNNPVISLLINASSEKIPLPDDSVDYIFTDPPYGDSIQYFELLSLWNAWLDLGQLTDANNEIIINSKQNKNAEFYKNSLKKVFNECFRVLKPEHYMHITFHNTDANIRNILVNAVKESGFRLEQIIFQMPPRNSLKSYLHYSKSPVGDYFIRFFKPPKHTSLFSEDTALDTKDVIARDSKDDNARDNLGVHIVRLIKNRIINTLKLRNQPTNLILIYNLIDEVLADKEIFPLENPKIIDKIIRGLISEDIIALSDDNKIWFTDQYLKNPSMNTKKDIGRLNDRIKRFLIENIENITRNKKSNPNIQDYMVYNMVYSKFNGLLTPDRRELSNILRELNLKKRK